MANTTSDKPQFLHRASGGLLAAYIRLVHATSRVVRDPPDIETRLRELHPFIFAMWHGQFMMLPKIRPDNIPVRIMVARHGDAEILGQALQRFDMDLIRGAGAGERRRDRGGAQALRSAVRAIGEGCTVAMTADVPPGPARNAGSGIITLARLTGRPIVAAAIATSRYHSFDTWSRFTVNLPFSRLGITLGEPVFVPRDASEAEQERLRQQVEDQLNAATLRAYTLADANPARSTPPALRNRTIAPSLLNGNTIPEPTAEASRRPAPLNPGLALKCYTAATRLLLPAAPMILRIRALQGKEDPNRRSERFGQASVPRPAGTLLWFHAASLGETATMLPVMNRLAAARPGARLLLTTGTLTSAALAAQRLPHGAIHQFIPLDSPQFVGNFLDHWRPDLAVFMESEIWPNLILECAARRVPLTLVNARMSKRSFRRWRARPSVAGPLFGRFDLILAQDRRMAAQFSELGARKAISVGNLKIDVPPPPINEAVLQELRSSTATRALWLAASTHEGEETLLAEVHTRLRTALPGLLTIIAPRHPERGRTIAQQLSKLGLAVSQRSQNELPHAGTDIYLADTMGELGTLFALAPVSFIGKSLIGRGGHNPIEAVRHGSAVVSGIHRQNFREAYDALARAQGAVEVRSAGELTEAALGLLTDPVRRRQQCERASKAIGELSGALERTVTELLVFLPLSEAKANELQRAS